MGPWIPAEYLTHLFFQSDYKYIDFHRNFSVSRDLENTYSPNAER